MPIDIVSKFERRNDLYMHGHERSLPLFDLAAGEAAKIAGMDLAAENKARLLNEGREIAREVALRQGTVTADDVQKELVLRGYGVFALGNAAGSLFKGREWEWTKEYRKSVRIHAKANQLKIWQLKREI